jgi:hypothetical protein
MGITISSIEETCVQASTAERTELYTRLLKLIELAAQRQSQPRPQSQAGPVAPTQSPIASPPEAPSSAPASPAPEPAAEPLPETHPEITQPPSAPTPEPISAIARCVAARNKARSDAFARSQPRYTADQEGASAFRSAMPPLLGADNIRDFIACVAHGMLIGVIENKDATKLLYAAQVAFSAQSRTEPKRTAKSASKAAENN